VTALRYQRAYRNDVEAIKRTLISTPSGAQIPIGQVAAALGAVPSDIVLSCHAW